VYLTDEAAAVVAQKINKSAKIRLLKEQGMRQADIARAVRVSDQFVSNVVGRMRASGRRTRPKEEGQNAAPAAGPVRIRVGEGWLLVIPPPFRTELDIDVGDTVVVALKQGELCITSPREALRRAQELIRQYVPEGRSLADELLHERRIEAERE
jgi:hypothetical protein